jgi:nucleoside-diphosphate-sugar epimerase
MQTPRTYSTRKRILVTGGAGFIGSHLCEQLLESGDDVLCVDNFFTGTKDNIAQLLANPRFELLRHDVTFPLYVEVDEIYNLACPAAPIHYQFDPVQTTKTSVHGAINMLGVAKRVKAEILQASTSEVYGDPKVHPQREDHELAQMIVELTGSKSEIVFKPLPPDDPAQRQPDIALAKSTLNWQPSIRLPQGLERTIAYFSSRMPRK